MLTAQFAKGSRRFEAPEPTTPDRHAAGLETVSLLIRLAFFDDTGPGDGIVN